MKRQKYFHPSSLNMEFREPKKGQQMVQILMKTIVICDSLGVIILWYTVQYTHKAYSMVKQSIFILCREKLG